MVNPYCCAKGAPYNSDHLEIFAFKINELKDFIFLSLIKQMKTQLTILIKLNLCAAVRYQ